MAITVYNTLSRNKETFTSNTPGRIGLYLCGPTVYSDAHLGSGKTATAFDVIRRWFEYRGYQVRFVTNVTDVGHITESFGDEGRNRIEERAKLERTEPMEIADTYYWGYFNDMARLNIKKPSITPRASAHIIEQIDMTQRLIERGLAYEVAGSVYFRVTAWPHYGKLSGRQIDELEIGTREEVREEKADPRDFALWKFAEPEHIMRWPSPWGEGFPGWHIECSAMALKYLGENFDIHGGGLDLQFPHHEAEIAQAEGAGYQFARYWLHSNMLTVNGEKMSKSKGNFTTLAEFFQHNDPMLLRLIFVQSHYRSMTEVSPETIQAAQTSYNRLRETRRELLRQLPHAPAGHSNTFDQQVKAAKATFEAAMDDDFNTPEALAALYGLVRDINSALAGNTGAESLQFALDTFNHLANDVFGLFPESLAAQGIDEKVVDGLVQMAIETRQDYRLSRQFAKSDAIRERLKRLGIQLEDTKDGARWKIGGSE
jgi:cysteinyl-tRNA synthetase